MDGFVLGSGDRIAHHPRRLSVSRKSSGTAATTTDSPKAGDSRAKKGKAGGFGDDTGGTDRTET